MYIHACIMYVCVTQYMYRYMYGTNHHHTYMYSTKKLYTAFPSPFLPLLSNPHLKDDPFDLKSVRTLGRTFYS